MIWIVSPDIFETALKTADTRDWYGTLQDAQKRARALANNSGKAHYVYLFEEIKKIEPENTFRLEFSRIDSDCVNIPARDLSEAIKIARAQFPANEWDLIRSYLIEKE